MVNAVNDGGGSSPYTMSPCLPQTPLQRIGSAAAAGDAATVNAAIESFKNLDAPDTRALFDELIKDPKMLDKFAHEMVDSGTLNGGISVDKQRSFFANIATKLTGAQLAKVEQAFAKADSAEVNLRSVEELSKAVSAQALPADKAAFVAALVPRAANQAQVKGTGWDADGTTFLVDPEARAIARVMSEWQKPNSDPNFAQAMKAISPNATQDDKAFNSVVQAAAGMQYDSLTNKVANGRLENLTSKLSNVVASLNGSFSYQGGRGSVAAADLKANFVISSSLLFNHANFVKNDFQIPKSFDVENAKAIANVINSDEVGVITTLSQGSDYVLGTALREYAQVMISDVKDGKKTLENQMTAFLSDEGPDGKNTLEILKSSVTPDGKLTAFAEQRGRAFGYLAGAISAGFEEVADNKAEQAKMIAAFLNDVLGFAKIPGANVTSANVEMALTKGRDNPARAMVEAMLPKGTGNKIDLNPDAIAKIIEGYVGQAIRH